MKASHTEKWNGNVDQATNHKIRVGGMSRKALKSAAVARRHRHGVQGNGQTHCVNAAASYTPFTEYTRAPPQNHVRTTLRITRPCQRKTNIFNEKCAGA